MTNDSRVVALERRHAELDEEIAEKVQIPTVDDSTLAHLKREKLRIKDEIHRLRGQRHR